MQLKDGMKLVHKTRRNFAAIHDPGARDEFNKRTNGYRLTFKVGEFHLDKLLTETHNACRSNRYGVDHFVIFSRSEEGVKSLLDFIDQHCPDVSASSENVLRPFEAAPPPPRANGQAPKNGSTYYGPKHRNLPSPNPRRDKRRCIELPGLFNLGRHYPFAFYHKQITPLDGAILIDRPKDEVENQEILSIVENQRGCDAWRLYYVFRQNEGADVVEFFHRFVDEHRDTIEDLLQTHGFRPANKPSEDKDEVGFKSRFKSRKR